MEEAQADSTDSSFVMSEGYMLFPPEARSRSTRSHSLKPLGQPSLLFQRSKRTFSLPSKPVLPPFIHIQRYHDNDEDSEEDDANSDYYYEEGMAWYTPVVGLSCSVVVYIWSCLLAYYSNR